MSITKQQMREDNPYAVAALTQALVYDSFSTGVFPSGFGGFGSAQGADSETKNLVEKLTNELLNVREKNAELDHDNKQKISNERKLKKELADLHKSYNKLGVQCFDLRNQNGFLETMLHTDTTDTRTLEMLKECKIVSITGVMMTTTDEHHGHLKKFNLLPLSSVNGDYLRTSEFINGHPVYVKIRGAQITDYYDKFGGRVCIWKSPVRDNDWLVGEPMHFPTDYCMAIIKAPAGKKSMDLAEMVDLVEKEGNLVDVGAYGFRHKNELMPLKKQEKARVYVKSVQEVMADLLSDANKYTQRLKFNETTFECIVCGDEKRFIDSIITPCGHVFCRECYHSWLVKNPNGLDCMCPRSCPVPFKRKYTPYTFPIDMILRYDEHGSVKDLQVKQEAARELAAKEAAEAAAKMEVELNAFRPQPGNYTLDTWLTAYGFPAHILPRVINLVRAKLEGRDDVWTLLDLEEQEIDMFGMMENQKKIFLRAAEGLRKAWNDKAMAGDGTLSAWNYSPGPFTRPQPGNYDVFSWLEACGVPDIEIIFIRRMIDDNFRDHFVFNILHLSPRDMERANLTRWQKELLENAATVLQQAIDSGVMGSDGTLREDE